MMPWGVTKHLKGGTNGLAQREEWLKKWKAELGSTPIVLGPVPVAPTAPPPVPLPPTMPKRAPVPAPVAARPPSITNPAKGSIGPAIAALIAAIFIRKT